MYPNFQSYITEAVENILATQDNIIDEGFSESVRQHAALLAGLDPSEAPMYWWSDSLQ